MRAKPELADIIGDLVMKAAGGPYTDEIVKRIRATMPPELLADEPLAAKAMQLAEQLKQSEDQKLTLAAALDDKKKNEAFANKIKAGELADKQQKTQIDLLKTLAEIEEMRLNAAPALDPGALEAVLSMQDQRINQLVAVMQQVLSGSDATIERANV